MQLPNLFFLMLRNVEEAIWSSFKAKIFPTDTKNDQLPIYHSLHHLKLYYIPHRTFDWALEQPPLLPCLETIQMMAPSGIPCETRKKCKVCANEDDCQLAEQKVLRSLNGIKSLRKISLSWD